jgi:5-methylcytosine-specific restriction protein A
MKLQRLPNRLASIATTRLPTLQTKAGATPRIRGDAWMATRRRVMQRDKYTCACCGAIRMDHECDHVVPLEQGGSNDDSNLQLLCAWVDEHGVKRGCHAEKTRKEAQERAGKR